MPKKWKKKQGYSYIDEDGNRVYVPPHKQRYNIKKMKAKQRARERFEKAKEDGTLFSGPKFKKYSEIIEMDDPESAEASVEKLEAEFDAAETKAKKLRILRVTTLAHNRASAMLKRTDLKPKTRREFKKVKRIFKHAKDEFSEKYSKS
jgi:hypothetical protein